MRKIISGLLMAVLALMFIAFTTGSSNAATGDVASLSIGTVGYNAVGADTFFNRNREFVDVVATSNTDVKDLVVTDSWGHFNNANGVGCNAYKVTNFLGGVGAIDGTGTGTFLPAGHTLRVYVGSGVPAVNGTMHYVYMNSHPTCGYHGHFINNLGDVLWISLGGNDESKTFNMHAGYYV